MLYAFLKNNPQTNKLYQEILVEYNSVIKQQQKKLWWTT